MSLSEPPAKHTNFVAGAGELLKNFPNENYQNEILIKKQKKKHGAEQKINNLC